MKRTLLALAILGTLTGRAAAQEALPGPFEFLMKFGPAIGIIDHSGAQFHLGMHFGINVTPQSPHHVYIDIPIAFNFGDEHTDIMLVPGIEADIALPVGVPIYIYPMFGIGLGFVSPSCRPAFDCPDYTALVIRMGAGVKYVLQGRWDFFFEPFNLDFWPAGSNHDLYGTPGHYSMLFGAGVNF